jgi:hypothetical protein
LDPELDLDLDQELDTDLEPDLDLGPDLGLEHTERLAKPRLVSPECTHSPALYVQRANWLATFTELQH